MYNNTVSDYSNLTTQLMRRLDKPQPTPATAFSPAESACLHNLHTTYGAMIMTEHGWQLTYAPEWLQHTRLQANIDAPLMLVDESPSTNKQARAHAAPLWLFADHQPAGLGQHNKQWLALPGDALIMSAILPTPRHISGLSVAIGAMLWQALAGDKRLRLKWPNDLLNADGKKVGGILVEVINAKAIIGVGLNRRLTPTLAKNIAAMGTAAAGLNDTLTTPLSRHECAVIVVQAIRQTLGGMAEGFSAFHDLAMTAHIRNCGETLLLKNGEQEEFVGFADDGALLTRSKNGVRKHIGAAICG